MGDKLLEREINCPRDKLLEKGRDGMMKTKMKTGKRLYINITNRCNTDCPFCCMYSGRSNKRDMDFETYKRIIDGCGREFELQLEGGEPLLHPNLYLFMEYARSTGRCRKILILTNGFLLEEHMKRLVMFAGYYHMALEIKVSINYWLIRENKEHLERIRYLLFSTEFIPEITMVCNVRLRNQGDEGLKREIEEDGLLSKYSNIYYLQSYGRLSEDSTYEKPVIVQNIEEFELYASDGTSFGMDLIARSEYEKEVRD